MRESYKKENLSQKRKQIYSNQIMHWTPIKIIKKVNCHHIIASNRMIPYNTEEFWSEKEPYLGSGTHTWNWGKHTHEIVPQGTSVTYSSYCSMSNTNNINNWDNETICCQEQNISCNHKEYFNLLMGKCTSIYNR